MKDRANQYVSEYYRSDFELVSCWEIRNEILISFEYQENGFDCTKTIRIDKTKISNN